MRCVNGQGMRILPIVLMLGLAAAARAQKDGGYGFTSFASSFRGRHYNNPREYDTYPAQYYSYPDSARTYRDYNAGGYWTTGQDYRHGYEPATGTFGSFSGARWNPRPGWKKTSHTGYYGPGYDRDYLRDHY